VADGSNGEPVGNLHLGGTEIAILSRNLWKVRSRVVSARLPKSSRASKVDGRACPFVDRQAVLEGAS